MCKKNKTTKERHTMKYYEALKKLFMEKKYSLPVFDLDDKIIFKTNRENK